MLGDPGMDSQKIENHTLIYETKSYRTLALHRMCPTIGDNVFNPFQATLIDGFMLGYEFDVGQSLARKL